MKQIRQRLTYANVMSSIAVFFILGGATAFAATKIGANEIKANAIVTGKIKKEAVTEGKIKSGAITAGKIASSAVTTEKIAADAVTGEKAKESTFGQVPSAATADNALNLGGEAPTAYQDRAAQHPANETNLAIAASTATDITPGGPVSLTVPSGVNFVEVDGYATLTAGAAASTWILWIQQDSTCAADGTNNSGYQNRPYGKLQDAADQETMNQQFVFAASPGVHTYRLCALSNTATTTYSRNLIAQTIARGASGAATAAVGAGAAGSSGGSQSASVATP